MEWLYYLIVCVISVCLGLVIIDFDYRKKSKWIVLIIAVTILGYWFTWQFRPLEFDGIVDIYHDTPSSYKVLCADYSIDSELLESDQVRREIWQDIRNYFIYTNYRLDIHSLLPWNKDNFNSNISSENNTKVS